jgi:hypothetical protein
LSEAITVTQKTLKIKAELEAAAAQISACSIRADFGATASLYFPMT